MYQVIHLHPDARPKPAFAQPCNGCGVCCASEPCPLGVLATGRTQGACAALTWSDDQRAYRCGLVAEPAAHLPAALRWLAPIVGRFAHRSISAGSGCDCSIDCA